MVIMEKPIYNIRPGILRHILYENGKNRGNIHNLGF